MDTDLLKQEPVPCYIDGKAHHTQHTFNLVDPHDPAGKVIYKIYGAQEADIDAAVDVAWKAFPAWSQTTLEHRREICLKAVEVIKKHADRLIGIEVEETVSTAAFAGLQLHHSSIKALEESAAAVTHLRGEIVSTSDPNRSSQVVRCPVLNIPSWNLPFHLGLRFVRDAILAGNTMVLKAHELCPRAHLAIAAIWADAGLPPGVLNVVHIARGDAPRLTERMIARREVRKVGFIGSTAVGIKIAETCARYLKPSVLELGGKAAFIVLPDADIELAVNGALMGGYFHNGQGCISTDLLLVHTDIVKTFTEALQKQLGGLKASADGEIIRGVFSTQHARRMDSLVDDALGKGGKIVAGKRNVHHNVFQPLVLGDITDDMRIAREEIFGPIVALRTFTTDDEAIEMVNASAYGLSSSIYGSDLTRARAMADRMEVGAIHVNEMTLFDEAALPHGGIGHSGWGRSDGLAGLHEFTYTKVITVMPQPPKYPIG